MFFSETRSTRLVTLSVRSNIYFYVHVNKMFLKTSFFLNPIHHCRTDLCARNLGKIHCTGVKRGGVSGTILLKQMVFVQNEVLCGNGGKSCFFLDPTQLLQKRLVEIETSGAISIQLDDAVGVGTVHIPIRQVNSFGVGIPGGTASIAVRGGGSIATSEVEFDAYGYANATVVVPEDSLVDVQVQSADNTDEIGASARIYGISNAMPRPPATAARVMPVRTLFRQRFRRASWIMCSPASLPRDGGGPRGPRATPTPPRPRRRRRPW